MRSQPMYLCLAVVAAAILALASMTAHVSAADEG